MTNTTAPLAPSIVLPSDQEASGRTLGDREIELVSQAIRTGTLTSTKGEFVRRLETGFAARIGVRYAYACSSGSAAIHAAISAIDPEPGDEIITTSITDMGALTPILYQCAIPVFAEVDPDTLNVTAETIAPMISRRTRAIIVTHLFGNPCDMGPIHGAGAKSTACPSSKMRAGISRAVQRRVCRQRWAPSAASACSRANT